MPHHKNRAIQISVTLKWKKFSVKNFQEASTILDLKKLWKLQAYFLTFSRKMPGYFFVGSA
jgi:hypothetical protein